MWTVLLQSSSDIVFEINDGCVCCTVRDGLVAVFEDLARRMDQFDHVIIETTGLADPGPVMRLFDRATVQSKFMLRGLLRSWMPYMWRTPLRMSLRVQNRLPTQTC